MKKRYPSIRLVVLSVLLFISLLTSSAFAAYDGKIINSDLNATTKSDHITLTWTGDPATTQTITWRTNTSINTGIVEYLSTKPGKNGLKQVTASKEVFKSSDKDLNTDGEMNIFSVTLTDLTPGTKYLYWVGDGTDWSDVSEFTTEAANTTDFKFMVFGDSQSGNMDVPNYDPWSKTLHNAYNANSDAKFFINVGDFVEKGQYYVHWNNWFDAAKGVIDTIPEMPVQGNHETYNAADWGTGIPQYYVNQFKVPQNGPDGYKGQVYSYDYGNAHFVVLDSQIDEEAPGNTEFLQAQADWLDKDLTNNSKEWNFVFFHKTPYYNKASRANNTVEQIFSPIIEKHHVDVVFNGHDHSVARTYPIKDGVYYPSASQGTIYYVTGRSGAKYYPDLTSKIWDAAFYDPNDMPNYETVQINGDKLTINAVKQDGTLIDTLVIDKDNDANSTKYVLPTAYNVDAANPEISAIGADPRLVIYGTPIAFGSNQAEISNGKAYANPLYLALYMGGSYDASNKVLTLGSSSYTFTSDMISAKGNVSIDALKTDGFNCAYNTQFNMVTIDK